MELGDPQAGLLDAVGVLLDAGLDAGPGAGGLFSPGGAGDEVPLPRLVGRPVRNHPEPSPIRRVGLPRHHVSCLQAQILDPALAVELRARVAHQIEVARLRRRDHRQKQGHKEGDPGHSPNRARGGAGACLPWLSR